MSSPDTLHPADGRAALLMIEFVQEWLSPEGRLRPLMSRNLPGFDASVLAAERCLRFAREQRLPVFHATLKLSPDYRELGRADYGLRAAIPRAGTWRADQDGWQFDPRFAPRSEEFIIEGRSGASAFANSNLESLLKAQGVKRLYLAGYATHVCVESTLRAAHDLAYEPVVLLDACAAFTPAQQAFFASEIVHHFGHAIDSDRFAALEALREAKPAILQA